MNCFDEVNLGQLQVGLLVLLVGPGAVAVEPVMFLMGIDQFANSHLKNRRSSQWHGQGHLPQICF